MAPGGGDHLRTASFRLLRSPDKIVKWVVGGQGPVGKPASTALAATSGQRGAGVSAVAGPAESDAPTTSSLHFSSPVLLATVMPDWDSASNRLWRVN